MAFEIKNPTLKNIIDFLKNQLGSMSLIDDAPNDSKKYSRKNGFWVEVNDSGGGGGESTNIGDEVYTEGDQLIIHSASTQIQDFFDNIAPEFDNTVSNSVNDIVMYDNKLFTLTEGHTAPATWENTTHVTTNVNNILKNKVNKNGDIMLGSLWIENTDVDIDDIQAPTTTKSRDFGFVTNDNWANGWFRVGHDTNNKFFLTLNLRRRLNNTTFNDNYMTLRIGTSNNDITSEFNSDMNIIRNGESKIRLRNNNITLNTAPPDVSWYGSVSFADSSNTTLGYLAGHYNSSKSSGIRILARNYYNSTLYDNYLTLGVNSDGTAYIDMNHPEQWRAKLFDANLYTTGQYLLAVTNQYTTGGYIAKDSIFSWLGAGPKATGDDFANCNVFRINCAANQTIILTEGTIQRAALIMSHTGGMWIFTRWGGLLQLHADNTVAFTWTGATNTLGTLKIKNNDTGYKQYIILFASGTFTQYTTQ